MPKLPPLMAGIWTKFRALHRSRRSHGYGPLPLDDQGVLAWKQNTGGRLDGWEWDIIQRVDDLYLTQVAKTQEREAKRPK